jgi:XTP/dITP diphosphohydrolase
MKLLLASHNEGKIEEIKNLLTGIFEVLSLKDLGFTDEIPETGTTFKENAFIKADYLYKKTNLNVISDDSGLEVEFLDNKPGVYSARFAGEKASATDNNKLLLESLKNQENRKAKFVCCICLIINGEAHYFNGDVKGNITKTYQGVGGFGYDPLFVPEGETLSFAEMDMNSKNKFSHRAKALEKLVGFLNKM